MVIMFGERGCVSQGRNGAIRTHGIEVLVWGNGNVNISPVTSRGMAGNCTIEIPEDVFEEMFVRWKKLKENEQHEKHHHEEV